MREIYSKNDKDLHKSLSDFEEIYRIAMDTGQLNIALKAKELIMKNGATNEDFDLKDFFGTLSYIEVEELADIVHAEFLRINQYMVKNFMENFAFDNEATLEFVQTAGKHAVKGSLDNSCESLKIKDKTTFQQNSGKDLRINNTDVSDDNVNVFEKKNTRMATNSGNPAGGTILEGKFNTIKSRNFAAFDEILRRYLLKRRGRFGYIGDYNDPQYGIGLGKNAGNPAGGARLRNFTTCNNPSVAKGFNGVSDNAQKHLPDKSLCDVSFMKNSKSFMRQKANIPSTLMGVYYVREVCDRILQIALLKQKKCIDNST